MPRVKANSAELPGQDSFLDIVANLVGILILLVMVVSLRAARASPTEAPPTGPDPLSQEVVASAVESALVQREAAIEKLGKAAKARAAIHERDAERVELATLLAQVEQEIEERRGELNEQQRRDFDLRAQLGAAEHELEKLTRERISIVPAAPVVEEIENLPTPLASRVDEEEVILRLSGGRVAPVPMSELSDLVTAKLDDQVWKLIERDSMSFLVGPVGGFRLRCHLQKTNFRSSLAAATGVGLAGVVVIPESEAVGDLVADAIQPGSALLLYLAKHSKPKKPPVSVAIHPDSFDDFRELRAFLHRQGYAVAGRPLPQGTPIVISPNGTRSAAQ